MVFGHTAHAFLLLIEFLLQNNFTGTGTNKPIFLHVITENHAFLSFSKHISKYSIIQHLLREYPAVSKTDTF